MKTSLKQLAAQYHLDDNGHFSVIFAIVSVPLLIASTFVIDYTSSRKIHTDISNALDGAALAAVLDQSLTEAEREIYARNYFWALIDMDSEAQIKFSVEESSQERISLKAHAKVPTSVSAAIGVDEINVVETAVSQLTKGDVVCMLALDPNSKESFKVSLGAHLKAKNCSVQVNSIDVEGAVVNEGGIAEAKDFCMSGGAIGDYSPFANTDCSTVADPYKYKRIPGPSDCLDPDSIKTKIDDYRAEVFFNNLGERSDPLVAFEPGTYCGGLTLVGKNVAFKPGEYIITDGPLVFGFGTRVEAKGVTFIFSGKDSYLDIYDGGILDFEAPKTGDLAGIVFAQHLVTELGKDAELPHADSVIRSGGELSITGTAYLPTQKIIFKGGSLSSAQAPATSFIAHQLEITDGAKIEVAVDHQAAGLPPILPRSDESVRLVE